MMLAPKLYDSTTLQSLERANSGGRDKVLILDCIKLDSVVHDTAASGAVQ